MKRSILVLFGSLLLSGITAQNWQWVRSAGGPKSDKATDISIDEYGNAYVVGYYNTPDNGNAFFGPLMADNDFGKEGFIAKINKSGNWQWLRWAQGGWDERVLGVHVDTINNFVYATGTAWIWTNFGSCTVPVPQVYEDDQIFVTKFDYNGNCLWQIHAGGGADDQGYDLVTSEAGNIYLTGFISDKYAQGTVTATFGTLTVPVGLGDSLAFVAKMTPSGAFQWVRTFGGCDGERDNRIAIDEQENVYVTGGYYGTKVFGTNTLTTNGDVDVYVVKYNSAGFFQWVSTAGSIYGDRGNSVTVDKFGGVYVTGEFRDYIIFGTDTLNNYGGPGGRDIFVAKMTQAGNWIWADKAGSTSGSDRGNMIIPNKNGNLYVTGQFKNTCKFSPTLSLTNVSDSVQIFVAGIDTAGIWQWALQGGSLNEDRGNSICVDDSCNIYATGYYDLTAAFGANSVTTAGTKDIFVGRINNACWGVMVGAEEQLAQEMLLSLFPNPARDKLYIADLGRNEFKGVVIMDLNGRKLLQVQTNEKLKQEIDISSLAPGVYLVEVNYGSKTVFKKLVKE